MKFLTACLGICLILLIGGVVYIDILSTTQQKCEPQIYKVYYEYDIVNNDTVSVDTIYVPLK